MHDTVYSARSRQQIAIWLFCLCGFIGLIVLVGGMTRLTDSGLSITEWKPVTGVLPPLSAKAWETEFAKYRAIPEYRLINAGMTLPAFKTIYWWEWTHRLLARLAGLVFLLPFAYFAVRRQLGSQDVLRLLPLLLLGGAQGVLGWYMVKSGLSGRVDVSQYRLAAHLGLAFAVYGYGLWVGLGYWRGNLAAQKSPLKPWAALLCVAVFIQVLLGALVAGLDAGLTYNSWPLMDGYVLPPGVASLQPIYLNLFENIAMVQFNHRWFASGVLGLALFTGWLARGQSGAVRNAVNLVLAIVAAQFALGIWTLLLAAPLALALLHQMGALLLFTATIVLAQMLWRTNEPQS